MPRKLFVANWKMNPKTEREAVALARASDAAGVVVCPPFLFLSSVAKTLKRAALGAQDAAPGTVGPLTGEVSAEQLKGFGVRYVILGHSERRAAGETEAQVSTKLRGALNAGLTPILCVGEPLSVRRRGLAAARAYVKEQMTRDLSLIGRSASKTSRLYVAYEPVWAISTTEGRHDPSTGLRVNETPEDAAKMAAFIRTRLRTMNAKLKTDVLYGGSVDLKNALRFLAKEEFGGILVGGASIRLAEFRRMVRRARL